MTWTTRRAYTAWKDAGLERITLHNARHSFRSYLDYAGISEPPCDRYLGHVSHSIGRRYAHAFDSQFAVDGSAFDVYLTSATNGTVGPSRQTAEDSKVERVEIVSFLTQEVCARD